MSRYWDRPPDQRVDFFGVCHSSRPPFALTQKGIIPGGNSFTDWFNRIIQTWWHVWVLCVCVCVSIFFYTNHCTKWHHFQQSESTIMRRSGRVSITNTASVTNNSLPRRQKVISSLLTWRFHTNKTLFFPAVLPPATVSVKTFRSRLTIHPGLQRHPCCKEDRKKKKKPSNQIANIYIQL